MMGMFMFFFFFQAEDGIRDVAVTGVQTCALPIYSPSAAARLARPRSRDPAVQHGDPHRSGHRRHNTRPQDRNPTPDTNSRCSNNSNRHRLALRAGNANDTSSARAVPDDTIGILRIADPASDRFLEFDSSR